MPGLEVPAFEMLNVTWNEPALCATEAGTVTNVAVLLIALTAESKNTVVNNARMPVIILFAIILCCNFAITLVFKCFV